MAESLPELSHLLPPFLFLIYEVASYLSLTSVELKMLNTVEESRWTARAHLSPVRRV